MKNPETLFFTAMGNKHRLRVLNALLKRPMTVSELSSALKIEQSNLSHHLKCLLDCRFVAVETKGRIRTYRLSPETRDLVKSMRKYIGYYGSYLKKCGVLS
jgi:DNA-binding transcriptional ArsR family regulator